MTTATKTRRRGNKGDTASNAAPLSTNAGGDQDVDAEARLAASKSKRSESGGDDHDAEDSRAYSRTEQEDVSDGFRDAVICNADILNSLAAEVGVVHDDGKVSDLCGQIQSLHREREAMKRLRVKLTNGLAAEIMSTLGYCPGLPEAERSTFRKRADRLIAAVSKGKEIAEEDAVAAASRGCMILQARKGLAPFREHEESLEARMLLLSKELPIADWVISVRGLGLVMAAMLVGEAGDLNNYSGPYKLFKRLGLAPYKGKMPSTHRRDKSATADDWTAMGYSPRRRSISYQVGVNIVMLNKGEYRAKYDAEKVRAKGLHPDWTDAHTDRHARLVATKLLIKHMWKQWTGK